MFTSILLTLLLTTAAEPASGPAVSPSGHYFMLGGKPTLLVGDSGTQCVMQNLNVDYRAWIDDLSARGLNTVHIWAFVPARQKQDGSVVEGRYGYVFRDAVPWARRENGPPAADQRPRWDLTRFDDGEDPKQHYWARLRDLAAYSEEKGMCLGVTLFFGWPKHDADWVYHPFNVANGGHLKRNSQTVVIETPGTEVVDQPWSDAWPAARKTQWVWERYARKVVEALSPFDNVFYVYKDERSYENPPWRDNMAGHFVDFLHRRGVRVVVDWEPARGRVDAVMLDTIHGVDKNPAALRAFVREPARPVMLLESPPYGLGDRDTRVSLWTAAMGGSHVIFHDDERQGTAQTGIMGYDPKVAGGVKPLQTYDWLGHLNRFLNDLVPGLDGMAPANERVIAGGAYCLADSGRAYACYLPEGGEITLDINALLGKWAGIWFDPRSGETQNFAGPQTASEGKLKLVAPSGKDWAVLVTQTEP